MARIVRLEIVEKAGGYAIQATDEAGTAYLWGDTIRTDRGAKSRLTHHAKRCGLVKTTDRFAVLLPSADGQQ